VLEDSSSDCLSIRNDTMIGSEPFRMSFLYFARAASRASLATVMMVCLFSAASAEEAYIYVSQPRQAAFASMKQQSVGLARH